MDKVVAITGASSGIGEAAARLLGGKGAKLVLGARRLDRLSQIASEIEEQGGQAIAIELDVTDPESMNAFVQTAVAQFGRIEVLVNNAGIMYLSPLPEMRVEEWNRMIDVNLKGVLNGIAAAFPQMQQQESGHFVNIGSIAGRQGIPMNGVYAATKFAVRALAESLRLEGGSAIRSTLISPGAVATELFEKIPHEHIRKAAVDRKDSAIPAQSIAEAIAFAIEQPPQVDVNEIIVRPMDVKY